MLAHSRYTVHILGKMAGSWYWFGFISLVLKHREDIENTWTGSTKHSLIISREGLILTLSILPCPQGRIFWSTPCRKIDDERMSVLHQNSGVIGKSIPSALEISLDPRDFPRASPSGNLLGLRKSLGRRDGFPNTSLVLVEHGYNLYLF